MYGKVSPPSTDSVIVTLSASIGSRFVPATFHATVCRVFVKYTSPLAGERTLKAPSLSTTLTFIFVKVTPPPPSALSLTVNPKLRSLGTDESVSQELLTSGSSSVRFPARTLDSLGIYLVATPLGGSERKAAPLAFLGLKFVFVMVPSSICSQV